MKSENANFCTELNYFGIALCFQALFHPRTRSSRTCGRPRLKGRRSSRRWKTRNRTTGHYTSVVLHKAEKILNHEIVAAVFKFIKEQSIVYSISYQIIETRIALADFEVWASSGATFSQAHVNLVLDVTLKKIVYWLRIQDDLFWEHFSNKILLGKRVVYRNFTCSKLVILMNVFPSNWVIGSHLRNSRDMFGKMFLTSESFSETRDSKLDLAKSDSKLKLPLP